MGTLRKRARLVWDKDGNQWMLQYPRPLHLPSGNDQSGWDIVPLNTADTVTAQRLKNQMNKALSDPRLLTAAAGNIATLEYDSRILSVLFELTTSDEYASHSPQTPRQIRDTVIPLPWQDDGYTRTLLVGTTGAGKTTLLRQLIGTHPINEHFPSTSTAKTTTSDFEVVFTDTNQFMSVVTFMIREQVKTDVEICVLQALHACYDEKPTAYIADQLLEHREQRFRLFYILGRWQESQLTRMPFDTAHTRQTRPTDLDDFRRSQTIQTYVSRVERLCTRTTKLMESNFQSRGGIRGLSVMEQEVLQEQYAREDPDFDDLVEDIIDKISERFRWLSDGQVHFGKDGWPTHWTYRTDSRRAFLDALRWFSSNNSAHFGRLVTPIVDGMRVSGRFLPRNEWSDRAIPPKIVLIDGEGLGHRGSSFEISLPSSVHEHFDEVDTILVVDNAQQPLLTHPTNVVRHALVSGLQAKLALVFTHFDQVKGINIQSTPERQRHLERSVESAIDKITEDQDREQRKLLRNALANRVFYCGNLHKPLSEKQPFTQGQLKKLLDLISPPSDNPRSRRPRINGRPDIGTAASKPESHNEPSVARITYASEELDAAIEKAVTEFTSIWNAIFGFGTHHRVSEKQHWTRIKALSRHIGHLGKYGYDTLSPADVLLEQLQEQLGRFLSMHAQFDSCLTTLEERQAPITQMKQRVRSSLLSPSKQWIIAEPRQKWKDAFLQHNGVGSTRRRAEAIQKLFTSALPHVSRGTGMNRQAAQELRQIMVDAIRASGGEVILSPTQSGKSPRFRSVG